METDNYNDHDEDANTIGWTAGMAACDWGLAVQIAAAASIGSDGSFVPTNAKL